MAPLKTHYLMKGNIMQLRHIVIAISLVTLSTPLLARTFECTDLDKTHWIPAQAMQKKLSEQGYQVENFEVTKTCYKAILKTENGQKFEAIYDPVEGHPVRRQVI